MCFLFAAPSTAFARDPALDVSQYAHASWKVRDGFVKGVISSIAQTPDGYLWLGTEFGLVRFDGVKATPWQPPHGQTLPSNRIFSLLAAHDGRLLIGTSKGLASWKDGKLTQYPPLAGQTIRAAIVEDHEGTIWAGGLASTGGGRLCAIQTSAVHCYGEDGGLAPGVSGLYEDREHRLWAGVRDGVWQWKPGTPQFYPAPAPAANGGGIQALWEGDDGALWFGAHTGIGRLTAGKTEAWPLRGTAAEFTAIRALRDPAGSFWIGTSDAGLVHLHQGRTDLFGQADGLSGDFITALFIDREGTFWVATDGGLDRFREVVASTLSLRQGLANASVLSVLADRDGGVWLSTRRGLNRWKDGQISVFGQGLLNGNYAGSLYQDSRGRVWASTLKEFGYLENGRFVPVKAVPGGAAYAIAEDAAGNLWIANRQVGLIQLTRGGGVQVTSWADLKHQDPAMALAPDPSGQGIWIGFHQGGILHFADGRGQQSYATEGRVNELQFEPDGALWAATEGGLTRLKNGRAETLNSKNGLPCDGVHCMLKDAEGSLWLYTTCGLVRLARSGLDAWSAEPTQAVPATTFGISDGVRSQEDAGGYTPHAALSADGRLWFLPSDGASVVDPRRIPFNGAIPPVHIEKIIANSTPQELSQGAKGTVQLPPLVRDLEIDYSGLSLAAPEKVRFRYMLEGRDHEWQDVGTRRQAFYNDLAPRVYRFRVSACNDSGVWNEAGAFVGFAIAPAYYQTNLFRLACVASVLAALWALYQMRLRRVAHQFNIRLEERVNERTRIARELHDTLLQSFQGILMKFSVLSIRLSDHPEIQKQLETIVAQAREAVIEGRDAVLGLRSSPMHGNEMEQAIRTFAEDLAAEAPTEFRVSVEGHCRDLSPMVRDEVYRIACEALRNACRHAQAQGIEAAIHYGDRHFRLRVVDNGKGIDPTILSAGGRAGHQGLPGMHERAKLAGGKLTVRSRPGAGTEIELHIPASIAYR